MVMISRKHTLSFANRIANLIPSGVTRTKMIDDGRMKKAQLLVYMIRKELPHIKVEHVGFKKAMLHNLTNWKRRYLYYERIDLRCCTSRGYFQQVKFGFDDLRSL